MQEHCIEQSEHGKNSGKMLLSDIKWPKGKKDECSLAEIIDPLFGSLAIEIPQPWAVVLRDQFFLSPGFEHLKQELQKLGFEKAGMLRNQLMFSGPIEKKSLEIPDPNSLALAFRPWALWKG